MEDALESALRRSRAPERVERRYPRELPKLSADAGLLGLALVNLIENACEAMALVPERASCLGLAIDVQAAPALEPTVRIGADPGPARPRSRELCIAVSDSGPGVPPDRRDRIFDPFFTTKPAGTGIGLATVQKVVAAHGGSLSFETGETGSCFRLHLPLAEEPGLAASGESA